MSKIIEDDSKNTDSAKNTDWEPGQTGAVKDPENDGRLKENREEGRTLGTTEHTREAPHVKGEE